MIKEGKWAHHAPAGYKNVRNEAGKSDIILDPDNHFIITKLFEEFVIGIYNLEQITRKAKELGLKMKKSKTLHKQTVRNILSNRFYIGEMYCDGQYYPHCYPTLVNLRVFNKCQEILEGKANHKVQKHDYVFKGLIRCQNCGGGSITSDLYHKKLTKLEQEKENLEARLEDYSKIVQEGFISLKYLITIVFQVNRIWDFLNNDKKQQILKLLCSEILLDGKNVVISIRKPILELSKIGSCQVWLGQGEWNQYNVISQPIPRAVRLIGW